MSRPSALAGLALSVAAICLGLTGCGGSRHPARDVAVCQRFQDFINTTNGYPVAQAIQTAKQPAARQALSVALSASQSAQDPQLATAGEAIANTFLNDTHPVPNMALNMLISTCDRLGRPLRLSFAPPTTS